MLNRSQRGWCRPRLNGILGNLAIVIFERQLASSAPKFLGSRLRVTQDARDRAGRRVGSIARFAAFRHSLAKCFLHVLWSATPEVYDCLTWT